MRSQPKRNWYSELQSKQCKSLLMRALRLFRNVNQHKQPIGSAISGPPTPAMHSNRERNLSRSINRKQSVQYVPIHISTFPSNHIPEIGYNQLTGMIIDEKHRLRAQEECIISIKEAKPRILLKKNRICSRHSSLPNSTLSVLPQQPISMPEKRINVHEFRNYRIKSQLSKPADAEKGICTPCPTRNRNDLKQCPLITGRRLNYILPSVRNTTDFADFEQVTGW